MAKMTQKDERPPSYMAVTRQGPLRLRLYRILYLAKEFKTVDHGNRSAEAEKLSRFLFEVLSIDYGCVPCTVLEGHDIWIKCALQLRYDAVTGVEAKSRPRSWLIADLDLHIYKPASELGIHQEPLNMVLTRYLKHVDELDGRYKGCLEAVDFEHGTDDVAEKVCWDYNHLYKRIWWIPDNKRVLLLLASMFTASREFLPERHWLRIEMEKVLLLRTETLGMVRLVLAGEDVNKVLHSNINFDDNPSDKKIRLVYYL